MQMQMATGILPDFYASKPIVDFMNQTDDPRLRIFYRPNDNGDYVGGFPSPDDSRLPANQPLYTTAGSISTIATHEFLRPAFLRLQRVGSGEGFYPISDLCRILFSPRRPGGQKHCTLAELRRNGMKKGSRPQYNTIMTEL